MNIQLECEWIQDSFYTVLHTSVSLSSAYTYTYTYTLLILVLHLLILHFVYLLKKLSTVSYEVFLHFTKGTIYVFSVFSSIVQIMLFTLFTYFPLGSYTVKQYCYIILAFLNESKLFLIAFLALLVIKWLLSY